MNFNNKLQTIKPEWKKKYPGYKFIKKDNRYRWSSPTIDEIIDVYIDIREIFLELGLYDLIDYYNVNLYPSTPDLHPFESERETIHNFKKVKDNLEDLFEATKEIYKKLKKKTKDKYRFKKLLDDFEGIYKKIKNIEEIQYAHKI